MIRYFKVPTGSTVHCLLILDVLHEYGTFLVDIVSFYRRYVDVNINPLKKNK